MKPTKILGSIVVLGVVGGSFVACTEPLPNCLVEDASGGPYILLYTVQGTAPACASAITVPGEQVGMSQYHPVVTNSDGSTTFNINVTHVAIQGTNMGNAVGAYGEVGVADTTAGDEPYAMGVFTSSFPDSSDLCHVAADSGTLADTAANGGSIKDNMTATENLMATTDTGALLNPPVGTMCQANADCGYCAIQGESCSTDTDCCGQNCASGKCGAASPTLMTVPTPSGLSCDTTMGQCVLASCSTTADAMNPDADCGAGLVCGASSTCTLGCRGMGGNGCDATYACSSSDNTIGSCALPQDTITYQWSNVAIYTTAAAQGTQVQADLSYTQTVGGAPCTVSYKAVGMWPTVACADANGNPDDDLCNPCSEPANGRAVGSGINFNFPTHCDPTLLVCTLGQADSTYKVDEGQAAKGILKVTGFTNATSIPQVLPDGDARIPTCQGE